MAQTNEEGNTWSKRQQKFVRSLAHKKYRDAAGAFFAEGPKAVGELAMRFDCRLLVATRDWLDAAGTAVNATEVAVVNRRELAQVSCLTTPHEVLAVFDKPDSGVATLGRAATAAEKGLVLALDGVQDPGNVGTIIRLADWFGINHVVCSPDTADAFAPKVVQSTMGALARVEVTYADLPQWLDSLSTEIPVYGTFMEGDSLWNTELSARGVVVMGNEGAGIGQQVASRVTRRLHIPSFPGEGQTTVESLNVAVASAVICGEFRRRQSMCLE